MLARAVALLFESDDEDNEEDMIVPEGQTSPGAGVLSSQAPPNDTGSVELPEAPWPHMILSAFAETLKKLGGQRKPFAVASGCSGTNSPTIALKVACLVFVSLRSCAGAHDVSQLALPLL